MRIIEDQVIGIVGGMGPEAGAALFNEILKHSNARLDQDHLSVILMSFPRHIVDRTSFLEGHTSINPAFTIVKVIRKLEKAGARIIGLACNTSYSPGIYNVIQDELAKVNSKVTILNMPLETCRHISAYYPQVHRVGVMTTNGTFRSGVYSSLLIEAGYQVVLPDAEFQDTVIHRVIYDRHIGLKANPGIITAEAKELLEKAFGFFAAGGANIIILGCTELSLVVREKLPIPLPLVDSTAVFAGALIREATGRKEAVGSVPAVVS